MADKLKIYACSGIGETKPNYTYWMDNTQTVHNTQAVNNLLSMINEKYAEVMYLRTITKEQVISNLNDIDLFTICLNCAQDFKDDSEKLRLAGMVIGTMCQEGAFEYASIDNDERDKHLDDLFDDVQKRMADANTKRNDEFMEWWSENVEQLNKVGLDSRDQQIVTDALSQAKISGVGDVDWESIPDLNKYLSDAGEYFLYTYFTPEQIGKLPRIFRAKKQRQLELYEYCKKLYTDANGKEEAMLRVIRSKIIAKFGEEPETVCSEIVSGKRNAKSVGVVALTTAEIITIITSIVVPVIVAIIGAIANAVSKKNSDKYASINKDAIEAGCPDESDYADFDYSKLKPGTEEASLFGGSSFGLVAIGVLVLLYLLNRK